MTFSPADLTRLDPDAYIAPAKNGTYQPIRLIGPNQPFVVSAPDLAYGCFDSADYYSTGGPFTAYPLSQIADSNLVGFPTPANIPIFNDLDIQANNNYSNTRNDFAWTALGNFYTAGVPPLDTGYDNSAVSIIFYQALDPNATITIKYIQGLESMVLPTSPLVNDVQPTCAYNRLALEAYYMIASELKHTYPADYNSLGTILSTLWSGVKSVASNLLGILPAVGDAARVYNREREANRLPNHTGAKDDNGTSAADWVCNDTICHSTSPVSGRTPS
jgi:hypothetical protein